MLNFPIVDTHVHFWDPAYLRYSWLGSTLNRAFLPADFSKHIAPVEVEKIVFVECGADPGQQHAEADWVTSLAASDPRIGGIVAHAPLEKGDAVRADLEKLALNPLVKGVRRLIQGESDLEFCLRPDFLKGVRAVADYNLSFDICIYHPQLASVIKMVRQCPNVRFILDHIGKPGIKAGLVDPWRKEIETLAELPNVWCKISGVATEADHQNWTPEALSPYIVHTIQSFGFERIMYGGDWPVSTLAIAYPQWVEILQWVVEGCSETELHSLFRNNAIAFYRLD